MDRNQGAGLKRAQTAAARLSAVFPARVFFTSQDRDIRKGPSIHLSPTKPTEAHIYKLEAAHRLPVANLRLTLSWYLLSPPKNLAFLKWTKKRFRVLAWMNRMGLSLGVVSLILPRECAPFLVGPVCLLALPASLCSYAMLSTDLLRILLKEYEFWFFTIVNVITWAALASLCVDVRVVILAIACFDTELMVLMDANFRTFAPGVRTCAAAIPVLSVLATLVLFRRVDFPRHDYPKPLRWGNLSIDPTEIFSNAMVTLLLLLLHKVYSKRKLLRRHGSSSRIMRCLVLRCALRMQPLAFDSAAHASGETPHQRKFATRVVLKKLGITAHKVYPGIKAGRTLNCRQQLALVSLRLSTFDARKTVYTTWWSTKPTSNTLQLVAFYCIGAVGLVCSAGSMRIPASEMDKPFAPRSKPWVVLVPSLGFICTAAFCAAFACCYQRDFARAMLRDFGFVFSSIQFSLACACLADALRWDNRCWAVASYWLWFHWILLLDAITPPMRKHLRFRKQLVVPVVVAVWLGMLAVLYSIIVDASTLQDRLLVHVSVGSKCITVSTKSILLNRVLTILVWTLKLMWRIFYACDAELVLLQGTLDYYCPFDSFSGSARKMSLKAIAPATGRCRESENSAVLGPTTEFSIGRRKATSHRGLRRGSSVRTGLVQPPTRPSITHLTPITPEMLQEIRHRSNEPSLVVPILTREMPSRMRNLSTTLALQP